MLGGTDSLISTQALTCESTMYLTVRSWSKPDQSFSSADATQLRRVPGRTHQLAHRGTQSNSETDGRKGSLRAVDEAHVLLVRHPRRRKAANGPPISAERTRMGRNSTIQANLPSCCCRVRNAPITAFLFTRDRSSPAVKRFECAVRNVLTSFAHREFAESTAPCRCQPDLHCRTGTQPWRPCSQRPWAADGHRL